MRAARQFNGAGFQPLRAPGVRAVKGAAGERDRAGSEQRRALARLQPEVRALAVDLEHGVAVHYSVAALRRQTLLGKIPLVKLALLDDAIAVGVIVIAVYKTILEPLLRPTIFRLVII